ncbi:Smr/MutS family protein [Magnetovirga frankeli]|uniref:Smr/MutS family protein n=1 Tax=Magnetovirga frankeli TaxID=947516 RepID=UPI001AFC8329|nr:Smr/MutS family protein [gamma proteobacterium SS-5]
MNTSKKKGDTINETAADGTAEAELFRQAMADARPLQANRIEPFRPRLRPEPIEQPPQPEAPEVFADRSIQTHDELLFMRPGLQQRRFLALQRGHLPPEETLDLHGYRVEQARHLLRQFIDQSRMRAFRVVRIIHGKGKGSAQQQPILKQKVNQWLPQHQGVMAYSSAPRWDGGTGATYVLLKRWREGEE